MSEAIKHLFPCEVIGANAMRELGIEIGKHLRPGDVVALIGNLGAGKTLLTQGIALSHHYNGEVTSPTFALVNEYLSPDNTNTDLFHFDIYRLEQVEEVLEIGWEDYLDRNGIVIVEWANKFPELFPLGTYCLNIEHISKKTESPDSPKPIQEGRKITLHMLEKS